MKPIKLFILLTLVLTLYGSMFTVSMTQNAIVLQLQEHKKTITEPGLRFKIPFFQEVRYFTKMLLVLDAPPADIITKDKKTMLIDNYTMWRIQDPLLFLQTLRTEPAGEARLDDIVKSELRVELGTHNLIDVVTKTREEIMEKVTKEANIKSVQYGIEVLDVRIKRADLPGDNAQKVFGRMRSERERIAKKYRSEGEEEATKIRAETDKEKVILVAEAYKKEQEVRGNGDARATKIYADAFNKDREFYAFMRSMEAYKNSLKTDTTVILSEKSDFLKYLNKSR
ncbi:MAG: protease modulator HflC [Nitrospinota bacterium]|nr:protease modulator HflC [Nitrospinota bacterium]MDH5788979.1 protease modulator HflC [Nitrospinota bacterium]